MENSFYFIVVFIRPLERQFTNANNTFNNFNGELYLFNYYRIDWRAIMKTFTSVDDLFEDITKNSSPWHRFILKHEWLRWLIYNAKDVPNDFYRKCKRGWQRAYRGWCDEDVWGFDWYLSKVIVEGLKKLKETKHGTPILDGYDGESDFEEMDKEWERILDTMIWTFETSQKIQNSDWLLMPINGWTENQLKLQASFHLMTAEETRQYLVGWVNFQKYYFALWD